MTQKTIIIFTTLFLLVTSCQEKPIEIKDGYLTLSNDEKINMLTFDTHKSLNDFYKTICADYCKRINIKNYVTHYAEFECFNDEWYKDTIYIRSEESTCVPLNGEKYTNVHFTFCDKNGYDILKATEMNYPELKQYFNDAYVKTAK